MSLEIVHFVTRNHLRRIYSEGVCLLRFSDMSGKMKPHSEAARLEQISWFTQTPTYKELDNFTGEPFVFEWMTFPGHTTMQLLQEIQIMMQEIVTPTLIGPRRATKRFVNQIRNGLHVCSKVLWPTFGVTPMWGPGGHLHGNNYPECCGLVKLVETQNQWLIMRHGSFNVVPASIGQKTTDQTLPSSSGCTSNSPTASAGIRPFWH